MRRPGAQAMLDARRPRARRGPRGRAADRRASGRWCRSPPRWAAARGSIVFDEPTSSLSEHEAERLFALIAALRAQGVTCLYVSHRMQEIFRLCDTITVLRDGAPRGHAAPGRPRRARAGADDDRPAPGGRDPRARAARRRGPERLRVEGLSSPGRFAGRLVSRCAPARCVGLAGLVGAGRSEVAQALFGLDPRGRGRIVVDGRDGRASREPGARDAPGPRPRAGGPQAAGAGAAMLGGAHEHDAARSSTAWRACAWIRRARGARAGADHFERLRVRAAALDVAVAGLSGGNQQKIVLAKWLAARCRVLDPGRADARRGRGRQGGDPRAGGRAGRATAPRCC